MSGRARSSLRGKNGWFEIELFRKQPSGWTLIGNLDNWMTHNSLIDGHFYKKIDKDLPREEYACYIDVGVGGQSTNGQRHSAQADEYVGPMPPPPPPLVDSPF